MPKKVLLVDDEKYFLFTVGTRIKAWGYDFIEASTGQEAIDAVRSKNPDVIVLDYMLPGMNGVETLKEIRKLNKDVPVIIFTAYPDKKSLEDTEVLGVNAYVLKFNTHTPTLDSLKEAIEAALNKNDDKDEKGAG